MDLIYNPAGSVYINVTPFTEGKYIVYENGVYKYRATWNGCTWELINNEVFLRMPKHQEPPATITLTKPLHHVVVQRTLTQQTLIEQLTLTH